MAPRAAIPATSALLSGERGRRAGATPARGSSHSSSLGQTTHLVPHTQSLERPGQGVVVVAEALWDGAAQGLGSVALSAGQAHLKAACIHPKGKGLRLFVGARLQACQAALTAWEGILDTQGI